jgi:hypothetical protein
VFLRVSLAMKVENGGMERMGESQATAYGAGIVISYQARVRGRGARGCWYCGIRGRGCEWLEFTITGCGTSSEV